MSTQSEASVESSAMSSGPSERRLCRRHGGGASGGSSETPPKDLAMRLTLTLGGETKPVEVVEEGERYRVRLGDEWLDVDARGGAVTLPYPRRRYAPSDVAP